jgi:hypothetical protein
MEVPKDTDAELIQQAFAYVARAFPATFSGKLEQAKARWIRLA